MSQALLDLPAPAKLNLFLHVTGRRADGYHLLETVFQFVDRYDHVDLHDRSDGRVCRTGADVGVPDEADLCVRAARALQRATGTSHGVDITLRKQIPMGAGMGGGSSDAATVLLGLNRLWGLGLDRSALARIGVTLGADVPVFVHGHNAYATGIGDELMPLTLPAWHFVVVKPPVHVPTPSVFADAGLTRNTVPLTIAGFSAPVVVNAASLPGHNDLEPVVRRLHPQVDAAIVTLDRAARQVDPSGASCIGAARMTGSGSAVFLVVSDLPVARRVAACVAQDAAQWGMPAQPAGAVHRSSAGRTPEEPVLVLTGLQQHPLGSRQVG